MQYHLTLDLPENVYYSLVKSSQQMGRSPEDLACEWLTSAVQFADEDPLEPFIGSFQSNVFDWAENHDVYLGLSLRDS